MKNKYTDILLKINETIKYFRHQDYYFGNVNLSRLLNDVMKTCDECIEAITPVLELILEAQSNEDYILVSDYLEAGLFPYINELNVNSFYDIDTNIQEDILEKNRQIFEKRWNSYDDMLAQMEYNGTMLNVEWSSIGVPTMKGVIEGKTFYFHSNNNPIKEAYELVDYYCSEDVLEYVVIGLGLSYIPSAILKKDDRYKVTVIEINSEVLHSAMRNVDMTQLFANERFDIILCKESGMIREIKKLGDKRLIVHYPTVRMIKDENLREHLNDYFIKFNSIFAQNKYLDSNFFYNQKNNSQSIVKVMEEMKSNKVMYIGGGPSLEKNLDDVKEFSENGNIVMCASTVYRQLIQHGIIPTYVMIIDAKESMVNHFNGIQYTGSKLIYMCTASRKAVGEFKGDKYICYQSGFEEAEQYAKDNNIPLIETGGSVSTAAIDIILRSGSSELITVGLDLAHTNGKSHSFTAYDKNFKGIEVKSVAGGMVETTKVLNIYRKWIENRIVGEKIKMVNISEGAYIEGMENIDSFAKINNFGTVFETK